MVNATNKHPRDENGHSVPFSNDENILPQVELVVEYFTGVKVEEMRSRSQKDNICTARQIVMALSYQSQKVTLQYIGSHFNRNHATVISGIKRVNDLYEIDKFFRRKVEKIKTMLTNKNQITHNWEVFNELKNQL